MGIESAELSAPKSKTDFVPVDIRRIKDNHRYPDWYRKKLKAALRDIKEGTFEPDVDGNKTADWDTVKVHDEAEQWLKTIDANRKANQQVSFLHSPLNGKAAKGVFAAMKRAQQEFPDTFKYLKVFASHNLQRSFPDNPLLANALACSNLAINDKSCGIYLNPERLMSKKEAMAEFYRQFGLFLAVELLARKKLRKQFVQISPNKIGEDSFREIADAFSDYQMGRASNDQKEIAKILKANFAQNPISEPREKPRIRSLFKRAA